MYNSGEQSSCDRSWSVLIEATDSTDCLDGYPQALRIVRLKRQLYCRTA
jgi:hypothetical protein